MPLVQNNNRVTRTLFAAQISKVPSYQLSHPRVTPSLFSSDVLFSVFPVVSTSRGREQRCSQAVSADFSAPGSSRFCIARLFHPRAFAPFHAREHAFDGVASARCVHGVGNPEWDTDSLPRRSPRLDERSQRLIHVDSGFFHARVEGAPLRTRRVEGPEDDEKAL